jgi:hypothetical protein
MEVQRGIWVAYQLKKLGKLEKPRKSWPVAGRRESKGQLKSRCREKRKITGREKASLCWKVPTLCPLVLLVRVVRSSIFRPGMNNARPADRIRPA